MDLLPFELWGHICAFLHPADLARLALTSPQFLSPARWHLYNKVVLRSDAPALHDTCRLLLNNAELSRQVTTVIVETSAQWSRHSESQAPSTTWLNIDIFRTMERLRAIEFTRLPCLPINDRPRQTIHFQHILASVYRHCPSLREIALRDVAGPGHSEVWTPEYVTSDKFPITCDLRTLIYKAALDGGIHWPFITSSFIYRSPSSLEHLDLDFGTCTSEYHNLANLSFPRLRTLYLRRLPRVSSTPVTVFLVAHTTLRYVHLLDSDPHLTIEKMNINMLPNLHTISARPDVLARLAQKCDSLRYIRCLVLDYDGVSNVLGETQMMIEVTRGFPNLRHISLSRVIRGEVTAEVMLLFCASVELECWTGGFYYRDITQLAPVARVLLTFPALSRLDICEWTYPAVTPPSSAHIKALTALAQAGWSMKKLTLYQTHLPSNEIATVFTIECGSQRRLTRNDVRSISLRRTYQYVEGGPHVQDRRRVDFASVDWREEALLPM